jgi:hypothetical protein
MASDPEAMSRAKTVSIAAPWFLALGLFLTLIATGAGVMDLPTLGFMILIGSWGLVQATVGALIAFRRPENRIGRVLQISGPLVISVFLGYSLASIRPFTHGPDDPVGAIAGWWASTTIFPAIFVAFPLVGILYPDGRLPGRRWRLPVLIVTVTEIVVSAMFSVAAGPVAPGLPDNPFGLIAVPADARAAGELVGPLGLVVAMGFAVVATAVRWRRGSGVERSQLKWLFAALLIAGVAFPLTFGGSSEDAGPTVVTNLGVSSVILIPIAIGIAVLRYRLYEIDRILSRTIAWAVVTGVLGAVFAGVVIALQAALVNVTQGQTLAVAASTLVACALFQPLRGRVQSAVDRRFDRARYDGRRTVDAFAEHLRDEVDLARLSGAVLVTADEAVRPAAAGLWLRGAPR